MYTSIARVFSACLGFGFGFVCDCKSPEQQFVYVQKHISRVVLYDMECGEVICDVKFTVGVMSPVPSLTDKLPASTADTASATQGDSQFLCQEGMRTHLRWSLHLCSSI